ncbi:hypothetical protein P8625_15320 [Tenacibaculum tangerinum]|uniref:DUF1735 domain-containing protein n=1 Tax=Tenacibaculum tangerinum TaxID=3038772 RepID=A0ABY8L5K7_9FLAO|nr:hypothetical protein [Tenacibaculum tangerinum]WGH75420.1 hypothetical protein P8625_15320 [Tenacibaculum tangerinum]
MKNIKLLFLAIVASFSLSSCDDEVEPLNTNYVTFGKPSYSTSVDVGATTTYDITVYTANITSSDRTFGVSVDMDATNADAGSYSVPSSVTIPANQNEGTLSVQLSDVNLGISVNKLVLNFDGEEGLSNGGSTTIGYIQNCNEVSGTLDIVFDGYGSETSWEILDSEGGVVASADVETYSDGQATASVPITLCAGRTFTFTIKDSYGDGLSYPANGTYTLTIGGSVKASGGGDFGSSESTDFDTN